MAQRTEVILTDDLDGGPADDTLEFGFGKKWYEIDLTKEHAEALEENLADFIAAAREISFPENRGQRRHAKKVETADGGRQPARTDRSQNQAIRAWWRSHGQEHDLPKVTDRGRIPSKVVEAYHANA